MCSRRVAPSRASDVNISCIPSGVLGIQKTSWLFAVDSCAKGGASYLTNPFSRHYSIASEVISIFSRFALMQILMYFKIPRFASPIIRGNHPRIFFLSQVAEVLASAVTRAPVESDSCLKYSILTWVSVYLSHFISAPSYAPLSRLSKWLAGCLPVLATNCSEERRSQLQQRLRSNKTFLKSKLLRLIEK